MALGADYITLAQLKSRLKITDTADDGELTSAIAATTDGIWDVTKRDFQKTTTASARTYRATHSTLVITADFHTTTGLVVKVDEDDDGVFETTLASTAYQLEPLDGVVNGREGWPFWKVRLVDGTTYPCNRRASVQVTAQWGWTAVPDAATEAAFILAEDIFKLKDTPFSSGGFSELGRIRARKNPHVAILLGSFSRSSEKVG